MDRPLFFSIVIPAHNEEGYIEATLKRLCELNYPRDSYEVIVVENGSKDKTFEKAQNFIQPENAMHAKQACTVAIYTFACKEAGVSRARNFGTTKVSKNADWVFFLDADTYAGPEFLNVLCAYFAKHPNKKFVVGSVTLAPYPSSFLMGVVYWFTNLFFWMSSSAYGGALLVRRELLDTVSFEEDLHVGEDAKLVVRAKKQGPYFFLFTNSVRTSTRRFQNGGWLKIPVWIGMWAFAMIVPRHASFYSTLYRRFKYKVVR